MGSMTAYILLGVLVAALVPGYACALNSASQVDGDPIARSRELLQLRNSDTTLRYADLSSLPADIAENNTVTEVALEGNITITTNAINQPYEVPIGTFHLGPTEVKQIISAVETQLVRCYMLCRWTSAEAHDLTLCSTGTQSCAVLPSRMHDIL